jgi:hypothetical protein
MFNYLKKKVVISLNINFKDLFLLIILNYIKLLFIFN